MADNLKKLLRLYATYARMDLLWFLRDTRYCLLYLFSDVVAVFSTVAGMLLLSAKFGGIGGMSEGEVLFMLGYAVTVEGLYLLFFMNGNTGHVSRIIGRGQLDHNLIQPLPLWMQFATLGFVPFSGCGQFLCGLALLARAAGQVGLSWSWFHIAALAGCLACSCAVLLSFTYTVSSAAFYAPAAAEEISDTLLTVFSALKTYPLGGLPLFWRAFLCSAAPIGLTAWLPSVGLLRGGGGIPALLAALTALFLYVATFAFKRGLNHYAKNGCPRYTGFGHR